MPSPSARQGANWLLTGVLVLIGFWLGLSVNARLQCPTADVAVEVPFRRSASAGPQLQQRLPLSNNNNNNNNGRPPPSLPPPQAPPEVAKALAQVVEKLKDAQDKAGGPDDDDRAVAIIARQLREGKAAPELAEAVEKAREAAKPRALPDAEVRIIGNDNRPVVGAAAPVPVDEEQARRNAQVLKAMESLKLAQMLDPQQVAPAAAQAGQVAVPAKAAEEPKRVPDYMLNPLKDEPPYGTPADPHPNPHPKVYCFVLTTPKRHDPKAIAVNQTWGARFDGLEFMTGAHAVGLSTVVIPIKDESRDTLWPKVKMSWLYAYQHHLDKFDWFMKADDDSFVVVDNLRLLLSKYDPEVPHFFGRRFLLHRGDSNIEVSYNSGGAGYVLSRAALRKLGDHAATAMSNNGVAEDVEISRSLAKLGIFCEDTRDEEGRERFLPLNIDHLRYKYTHANKPYFWYWKYSYYPTRDGLECCSKHWISTHYMYSKDIYRLEADYLAGRDGRGKDPEGPPPDS